ncbi:MAG: tetratricopeptide repeat protein, partial [Bacteroidota bacterium]
MKSISLLFFFCLCASIVLAQSNPQETARIMQQMAKIRQTADWDNPAAAKKANKEIQKLAKQLTGSNNLSFQMPDPNASNGDTLKSETYILKTDATRENVLTIAERFYKRSYKKLEGVAKFRFDQDFAAAKKDNFSFEATRKLTSLGAALITFGNDHNIACVYLTAAVKAFPTDTLSINNFGGYLRIIDSIETSVPVLLYANKLFSESPVILTQLGNSYFDLNDLQKAESFYKLALKFNPDFAQAHTALCDLYISQKRMDEALKELFYQVKGIGFSYQKASQNYSAIKASNESSG